MVYDTLGKMIDSGHRIAVYCERPSHDPVKCNHSAWLGPPALAERLGRDHGALHDDLVPKLRCSKCQSREVTIRIHPPTTPIARALV